MANNPLSPALYALARTIVAIKPQLIDAMGETALKFVDDNFKLSGFQGKTFQPWPKRKRADKGKGRKLLVQTGDLRRSITKTDGPGSTTLHTDIAYAQIHNEGGTINIPSRAVILNFKNKKGGKLALAKVRTEDQQRRIATIRRATIGEHTINMPQRQFLGPSPVLTNAIQLRLIKIISSTIK